MFGAKKEITSLKEALESSGKKLDVLEKQYNSLQQVLESMVEGVVAVDKVTRITSLNSSVEKILNISKKESEGKFLLEAIRNNDIAEIVSEVLAKAEFICRELNLLWPIQRIFRINASPILENKSVGGCLLVIHDITEIRRLEIVRSDFVANVSHELKTPLTSIKGFVETLLEGALEDKENNRNFLKIIQEHAGRLDKLVNDLLSLSHLESQGIVLDKREFNLNDQVKEVIAGFKSQLKSRGIEVTNQLPKELIINADKDRLEQVLVNLIDNAIKFNKDKGFIKIYNQDDRGNIKVIIEDFSMGIPGKDISRIFERFYRVDKARSRQLGGTGLGLSIVKHIVELHGGSVGVESTEGLGSKFWFILPK